MVVKRVSAMLRRIIAIKKLNNIMINCLQNLRPSILPDKWRFDMIQDCETFASNFDSFSTDDITEKTLQALGFHISATGYLEKRSLRFTDVTGLQLYAKLAVVDNPSQVVTNLEENMIKKKNKHAAKRRKRLAKLCSPLGSLLSPYPESSPLSSPSAMPALMPAFVPTIVPAPMPALMPALVSVLVPAFVPAPIPALILVFMSTPVSHPGSPTILLSCHSPVFYCGIPALLSPLPSMLDLPFSLGFSPL